MRGLFLALLGGLCFGGECFAAECRVAIPLERLAVSCDGMAMVDENDGVIELKNLHHDEEGFYTVCQVEVVEGANRSDLTLACNPACLSRMIERYLADPDVAEQFLEKMTCDGDAGGNGGAKRGSGAGRVTVEDKEKKWKVDVQGGVRHANGQTDASVEAQYTREF